MAAEEYAGLLASVQEKGVLTPLDVTEAGVVLDGRHRLRAAQETGLAAVPVRVVSPDDEVEHIIFAALHRRHLSQSQKAALALDFQEYLIAREDATARRLANLAASDVATLPPRGERTRELAARLARVSPRSVQDAIRIRAEDADFFQAVKAGEVPVHRAVKELKRRERHSSLPPAPPLPDGPFQLIYGDPPYASQSPTSDWAPENHYPTMSLAEIKAVRVPAAEDAVLFLWAVNGQLEDALAVMRAWDFEYKAKITWVKTSIGLGQWVRNRDEPLLIGRRGNFPVPDEADRPGSVIEAPRGRDSEKPEVFYEVIERMYPWASKLELFARKAPPGWASWGNEVAA